MKLSLSFAWYDLWVGAYWSREKRVLHLCLIPTIVLSLMFKPRPVKLTPEEKVLIPCHYDCRCTDIRLKVEKEQGNDKKSDSQKA